MRTALCLTWVLCFSVAAVAQGLVSQQAYVRLTPVYQSWNLDGGTDFSEFTLPLFAYYPASRNVSVTVRANQSNVSAQGLSNLNGVTDTQIGFNYSLENPNVVFNVGLNVPTGKVKLDSAQFRTSSLISNNIFSMRIPNFGQGLNLTAGFTYALPVTDVFVVGFGASYQLKGGFRPLDNFAEDYKPGNEILLAGGFDVSFGQTRTFSTDLSLTLYSTDKIGDDEVFSIGNKFLINAQYRQFFGFNELRLFARFRSRAKNQQAIVLGEQLQTETERTFPNQFELLASYRWRVSRSFSLRIVGESRFYERTAATFSGVNLFGGGLATELTLSRSLTVPVTFKYLSGSLENGPNLSGVEFGVGMTAFF